MRRLSMLAAAWLLVATGTWAQEVVQKRPVSLRLDIDTHGQVAAVTVMDPEPFLMLGIGRKVLVPPRYGPLPPALKQAAAEVASKWRFRPAQVAGKPVTGRTWAQATLEFVKHADGNVGVALHYLRNGPYMATAVAPDYPQRMALLGKSGSLAVEYTVRPDGSIDDMRVLQAFGGAAKHEKLFERAVWEALRQSHDLPLLVDGKAVASRVRAPYVFTMASLPKEEADRLGRQAQEVADPDVANAPGREPLSSGEAVAIDSPFLQQPSG